LKAQTHGARDITPCGFFPWCLTVVHSGAALRLGDWVKIPNMCTAPRGLLLGLSCFLCFSFRCLVDFSDMFGSISIVR